MPDAQVLPDRSATRAVLPEAFGCSWRNGGPDAAWVRAVGALDIATTPQLERTLSRPELHAALVVLDLRELAFMDSSGVHTIVNASSRAREVASRLVVLRAIPDVDRLFTLTGTSGDVEIADIDPIEPAVQVLLHL
jgi:anti-anti-sigma factor